DRGMITRSDPQPRVAVNDPAVLCRNGNVGEQAADETGPDGNTAHCADHRLVAVDHIVDDVARLLPLSGPRCEIINILLNDREIAAGRKYFAGPGQNCSIDARVPVNVLPDIA